jgi:hypothetical protein
VDENGKNPGYCLDLPQLPPTLILQVVIDIDGYFPPVSGATRGG